ncbi:hypothetical protein [Trinickia sp. EG282A]|uniref:hypothetical protein n=1 Tax=Trinickia sp. EG282A TaxID=3237013 RepID=UPI0034D2B997
MSKTTAFSATWLLIVVAGLLAFLGQNVASLAGWHLTAISVAIAFIALGVFACELRAARG